MPPERLVVSDPQEHIPEADQAPKSRGSVANFAKQLDAQAANTRAKAPGFVAQRQGAGEVQEENVPQSLSPPPVRMDLGRGESLRRQAGTDVHEDSWQSKAAPRARDLMPVDDPVVDWGEEAEEERRERQEVLTAMERATELAERYFAKAQRESDNQDESARVAELCVRIRALLQEDTDSEAEGQVSGAAMGQTAASPKATSKPAPSSSAAISQPMEVAATRPQATSYMAEKGFQSFFETKDGLNLVHHCCVDSEKRSAIASVVS